MNNDYPPSYDDVLNQTQALEMTTRLNMSVEDSENRTIESGEQRSYWLFLRINFTIFDIAISMLTFFGYVFMMMTNVFDVSMVNISEFCEEDIYKYNRPNEFVGLTFISISLITIFACICMTSFLPFSCRMDDCTALLAKILRKIWIITISFLFVCIEVRILQLTFGVPRPYYFSNTTLYNYYCGNENMTMSKNLQELDKEQRMSFPSFVMTLNCFSTAFLMFYLDHFDIGLGPHTAQYVILVLFGSKCMVDGVRQYINHEHHLVDILGAVVLGIATAAFTVRNLKGTVLRNINSMPKYVTNGMLLERLRSISRNCCSNRNSVPQTETPTVIYEYVFPNNVNQAEPSTPETRI